MPENILATLEAQIGPDDGPEEAEAEEETTEPADPPEDGDAAQDLAEHATEKKEASGDKTEKSPDDDTHKAGLRQADYTKKTQALAEERKALYAEIGKERQAFKAKEEQYGEVKEWLESLSDPETMEFELTRYYPDAVAALRDKWILESQEESQLTERERAAIRRAKDAEIKLKAHQQTQEYNKKQQEKHRNAQETAQLRTQFMGWLAEVMGPAGLDDDEDTRAMIRERLIAGYNDVTWTKETFAKAAADIARRLKREPKAKAEDKLPPSAKGTGHKAPPDAPKKRPVKRHSEEYFQELRAKYGVQ
jgi:hypothetical protein